MKKSPSGEKESKMSCCFYEEIRDLESLDMIGDGQNSLVRAMKIINSIRKHHRWHFNVFISHLLIISNINFFYNFDSSKCPVKGSRDLLPQVKSTSHNNNSHPFFIIVEQLWNIHYMPFLPGLTLTNFFLQDSSKMKNLKSQKFILFSISS